ncbi:MAG: CsgG/HfaB family protein [Pseudomonadota bacterium]
MKNLIVISALATVLTFGSGFFGVLSGQEIGEKPNALTLTQVPTQNSPYVPWIELKTNLERARSVSPENYAVPYYLGLVYLQEGNRDSAITEWEEYLAMAPEDFKSVSVREQLTVLKLDQVADYARQVVGQSPNEGMESRLKENTLAVLNFKNLATPDFIPFIKALTMILITDLSKISRLVLVERLKAQAVIAEMKLGASGIADPETASKAGRFLLAKRVVWGAVVSPRKEKVQISAIVGETLSSSEPVEVKTEGAPDKFFELEKQIVFGILAALGFHKEVLPPSVLQSLEKYHTTNYKAFMFFGEGLDKLDRKDFAGAKSAFKQALDADPDFNFSSKMEKSTPRRAITLVAVDKKDGANRIENITSEINDVTSEMDDIISEEVSKDAQQVLPGQAEPMNVVTQMSSTLVSQSSGITSGSSGTTKEISDIAQDKLETVTTFGNIIVHW